MEGSCVVCRKPTGQLDGVCGNLRCGRRAKPCRQCGTPKTGRSPYCRWCKRDKLDGARLTRDPEWSVRRLGRDLRPPRRPKVGPPMAGLYWCNGCRDWLHPRWFLKWNDYRKGKDIPPKCRPCRSQASHDTRIRQQFGIDPDEYQRILAAQDGVCAICHQPPATIRLSVDHEHDTGRIRGLLCHRCNHELLGAAHDSIVILHRAVAYLESPPAQRWQDEVADSIAL
jgi:Recombination endonuclease VII